MKTEVCFIVAGEKISPQQHFNAILNKWRLQNIPEITFILKKYKTIQ